ncbi:aerolysin family beta-barrel pore-forming toxin [Microbulbifer sp.]|uniref:aerolysin family beta-barrel pore-forming toxin n=1 Tax=Microbulbifer sp. TaxID=1908541 RepID=UPI003F393A43
MLHTRAPAALAAALTSALAFPLTLQAQVPDDIPDYPDKEYARQDAASLKYAIVSDPEFHEPLIYLAHFLGYAWCSGTGSNKVGEDFSIHRDHASQYTLQARYHSNDPYSDGYRAHDRLKMRLSNLRFLTNPGDLELGEPQVYNRVPIKTVTYVIKNEGNTTDTKVATLSYNETESWSKEDNFSFTETIGITNTYEFDLKVMGTSTEVKAEFSTTQGWSETRGESNTVSQSAQYRAQMPPRTKREITITFFKQTADIPYHSRMFMDYNVNYENFLRWSGNARTDHPTHRPWEVYTFGGRNNLNAAEDVLDQYLHQHISGYSQWDWAWMTNEFGANSIRWTLGNVSKRKYGAPMTGKFTTVDAGQYDIVAGPAVPLTDQELNKLQQPDRANRSLGGETLSVVREQNYDWENRVTDVTFTVEGDLRQSM